MSLIKFPKPKQDSIPIGSIASWSLSASIPTGWLECNGAAVSRSVYVNLFDKIGTTFGSGDGSTTFNIPDLRGEFIRGWDHNKGVDTGRIFGSFQNQSVEDLIANIESTDGYMNWKRVTGLTTWSSTHRQSGISPTSTTASNNFTSGTDIESQDSGETRPRNVALIFIIKAEEGAESVPGTWAEDHLNASDPHTQYTTAAELSASIYNHELEYDHTLIGSGGDGSGGYAPSPSGESTLTFLTASGGNYHFSTDLPWNYLINVPSAFNPEAHLHEISDVNNLQSTLDSKADSVHSHSADMINVIPSGNISSTTVQNALIELDNEKALISAPSAAVYDHEIEWDHTLLSASSYTPAIEGFTTTEYVSGGQVVVIEEGTTNVTPVQIFSETYTFEEIERAVFDATGDQYSGAWATLEHMTGNYYILSYGAQRAVGDRLCYRVIIANKWEIILGEEVVTDLVIDVFDRYIFSVKLSDTQIMALRGDTNDVKVITLNGDGTSSYSSTYALGGYADYSAGLFQVSTNKVVHLAGGAGSNDELRARVITWDGSTFTPYDYTFIGDKAHSSPSISVIRTESGIYAASYGNSSDSVKAAIATFKVSGTNVIAGTNTTLSTGISFGISSVLIKENKFALFAVDNNQNLKYLIVTVNDDLTITSGGINTVSNVSYDNVASTLLDSKNIAFVSYDQVDAGVGGTYVFDIQGDVDSLVLSETPYELSRFSESKNSTVGTKFGLYHLGSGILLFCAGGFLQLYKADYTGAETTNVEGSLGVTETEALSGSSVSIYPLGVHTTSFTNLSPGMFYYIEEDGTLTTNKTATSRYLGVSTNTTSMITVPQILVKFPPHLQNTDTILANNSADKVTAKEIRDLLDLFPNHSHTEYALESAPSAAVVSHELEYDHDFINNFNWESVGSNIIPSAGSTFTLGTSASKWKEVHADEMFITGESLYVNGKKVLGDDGITTVVQTSTNTDLEVKTLGSGDIRLNSENTIDIDSLGGVLVDIPDSVTNKNISITNDSPGGDITLTKTNDGNIVLSTSGTNSQVQMTGNSGIVLTGNITANNNLTILGDLIVEGSTTTISTTNLTVEDNIIVLNEGEIGSGIGADDLGSSGIQIDRGDSVNASIIYNDATDSWMCGLVGSEFEIQEVNFETLNSKGDVGTGSDQLAIGNHTHSEYALAGETGGSSLNYNTYTTTGNLSASTYNVVNTSASSFTLTMPVSASFGDQIWIHDLSGTFKANPLTIDNNGIPIRGLNENHILDIDYTVICYTYYDTDIGWIFSYSGTEGSGNPAGIDEGIATNGDCDLETGRIFDITVSGATTISFSNVPSNQAAIALLRITNGGTNVTWPSGIIWPSGNEPILTTTGLDYVTVLIDSSGMISATYDLDMK